MTKPKILVSNDDGIDADGLRVLVEHLRFFADVWVVAPDRERSANSHAISLHEPLRAKAVARQEFSVDGTPSDCVYIGLHHFMDSPPDLVISGINHGSNLGNDVIYSGTVAAAMEGALFGYSALSISLSLPDDLRLQSFERDDFVPAARFAASLAQSVLAKPLPPGVLLNVNIPNRAAEEIKGHKLCRLGYTDWAEAVDVRVDPRGRNYFWIGGQRKGTDMIDDSDINAVAENLISVTPIHYDITDYRSFDQARSLDIEGFAKLSDNLGSKCLPHPVHPKNKNGS